MDNKQNLMSSIEIFEKTIDNNDKLSCAVLKRSPSLSPKTKREIENGFTKKTYSSCSLENQTEQSLVPLLSSGSYRFSPKQGLSADVEILNDCLYLPVASQPRNSATSLKVRFDTDVEFYGYNNDLKPSISTSTLNGASFVASEDLRSQSRTSTCTVCSSRDYVVETPQEDDEVSEDDNLKPLDGGYGWIIVISSFFIHLIADGITFSFGVIFIELLDYFQESRGKTAWIASLFMSLPLFAGPVASSLTDRFGCKAVTIAGGIISAIGFLLSSVTNSIEVLFITFGIIPGLGLSFCYVAAIASVAYYFEAKRSLAIGLAVSGSGIGTFVFAPLTQALLEEYGWRGTTIILAGVFLNLCVCGMLMRELETASQKRLRRRRRYASQTESTTGSITPSIRPDIEEISDTMKYVNEDPRMCTSLISLPTYLLNGEKVPLEVFQPLLSDLNLYSLLLHLNPSLLIGRSFEDQVNMDNLPKMTSVMSHPNVESGKKTEGMINLENGLDKKSSLVDKRIANEMLGNEAQSSNKALPTHLLKDIRVNKRMLTHRCAMLNLPVYRLRASSCPDLYRNSVVTLSESTDGGLFSDLRIILSEMCDVSNLKNTKFLLFLFSNFLLYAWYDVPYIYLVDSAVQRGISKEKASFLPSVIGIVNTLGGVLLGFLGDKSWMDPHLVYAILMCLCGVSTGIIPLLHSYDAVATAADAYRSHPTSDLGVRRLIRCGILRVIFLESFIGKS
ncbi:uncharacterized protein LOC136030216 isoform X2 [Artemia franciscana]|uniref:uncharacterized protein LOC136030216 isoform X2 n=1 Tax=Artemia franciscana TaxID=6661 RepID=UPI0032DA5F27